MSKADQAAWLDALATIFKVVYNSGSEPGSVKVDYQSGPEWTAVIDNAPSRLDTLKEVARQLETGDAPEWFRGNW